MLVNRVSTAFSDFKAGKNMENTDFLPSDLSKPLRIEFDDENEIYSSPEEEPNEDSEDSNAELIFDFFSPMTSARTAYTHFYRDVLSLKSVADAEKSIAKIDDLFRYFHRLDDFAGKHHAMILALTGRNRAKWRGALDIAEIYDEWLRKH